MSATAIVGPPIMTGLFSFFTKKGAPVYFPGSPFLLGSVLMIVSTILAYHALKTKQVTAAEQVLPVEAIE
jgi:DHA1 family tetracycline resistance protein-like MFS transporter